MLLPIWCVIFNMIVRTCLELYFQIVAFTHSYSVYFTLHNIYLYTHKYCINIRENRKGDQKRTIQRHWQYWAHTRQDEQLSIFQYAETPLKSIWPCKGCGRENSSCSTSGTRRVTGKRHERHSLWDSCWTTV
jgi:hypothetical protein